MTKFKYGTGAVPDAPDKRDFQFQEVGFGAAPFDWSIGYHVHTDIRTALKDQSFNLPVKDQNGSFSCGGQAWAYYNQVQETIFSGTFEERSARFIYSQTHAIGGGSHGRVNAELVIKQGCTAESLFTSYDDGKPPTEAFITSTEGLDDEVKANARKSKESAYANVPASIDVIAQATRENYGCILGITGTNNGTWLSKFPTPPAADTKTKDLWHHWLYVGGAEIIDNKKYLIAFNSWGSAVGQGGWQWISEDYVNATIGGADAIWQVWTHTFDKDALIDECYSFNTDLQQGMIGEEVVHLQKALKKLGFFNKSVTATGYYGNITTTAVKDFQKKHFIAFFGTPGYGRCGPKTRAKLNSILCE